MRTTYSFSKQNLLYKRLIKMTLILAVLVIMLGAYTRLTDAGLGCPDWPGCYGKLVLPNSGTSLTQAQQSFPAIPIVAHKAWTEMVHRYAASILGTLILILSFMTWRTRGFQSRSWLVPCLLIGVVIFQALLGKWTVTMKLLPLVVMGHLMGGMTIAGLLCWLMLSSKTNSYQSSNSLPPSFKPWIRIGLIILIIQIFLGAWTSTNYAALACTDFPFCHGSFFPHMDWKTAFNFTSPIGPNYEGGQLNMITRVTLQMAHRYGAFITFVYLTSLSLFLICKIERQSLRLLGLALLALLIGQFTLGVLNVELLLPLPIAVAHNGIAALLLLIMVSLTYYTRVSNNRRWV